MMLQFNSTIIDSLAFKQQNLYLQGFTQFKIYLRKPCSFDFVTLGSKLIPGLYQFYTNLNLMIYIPLVKFQIYS